MCEQQSFAISESALAPRLTRAITLTQPWATLFIARRRDTGRRSKNIESRSWRVSPDSINGKPLVIHAALNINRYVRRAVSFDGFRLRPPYGDALVACGYSPLDPWNKHYQRHVEEWNGSTGQQLRALPVGCLLGCVTIDRILPARFVRQWHKRQEISELEIALGQYDETDGARYGWMSSAPRELVTPIPYRGAQGLWRLNDDVTDQLEAADQWLDGGR